MFSNVNYDLRLCAAVPHRLLGPADKLAWTATGIMVLAQQGLSGLEVAGGERCRTQSDDIYVFLGVGQWLSPCPINMSGPQGGATNRTHDSRHSGFSQPRIGRGLARAVFVSVY